MNATLPELIQTHTIPLQLELTETNGSTTIPAVVGDLGVLLDATPYPCEEEDVGLGREELAERYFRLKIGQKYKLLDPRLFELKRRVDLDQECFRQAGAEVPIKPVPVSIPALALAEYGTRSWAHRGECVVGKDYWGVNYDRGAKYTVRAAVPLIPKEVKEIAAEAMAFAHEVCAETLRIPTMRRYLASIASFEEKAIRVPEEIFGLTRPSLKILWKPTVESLEMEAEVQRPKDRDPALLLHFNGDHYLVCMWNVDNEEPLGHYLREFSQPEKR